MVYGKAKDVVRRTQSDKVLRDQAFNIASDPKVEAILLMNQIIS